MRKTLASRVFKRAVAVVAGIVLLLSAFPVTLTFAADVNTQADLLTAITNNTAINLKKDIILNDSWSTPTTAYSATFNGNGHVISNLNAPLMSTLSGTVKNIGLMCKNAMNGQALLAKTSSGTVEGAFAYGSISYNGTAPLGGLIGEMTAGSVTKSFACVEITTATGDYVGGLIGKLSGGNVESCYAAGSILSSKTLAHTGGLAYAVDADKNGTPEATAEDIYSSMQLRVATPYAKPLGVPNGLYDNQLSIVRESADDEGLSTRELMEVDTLSENFAVTSTAYPALTNFYNKMWGATAQNVVRVSTAAAAFTDVNSTNRMEPTSQFVARADYLLAETLVDKTNTASLVWNVDSTVCRVYDTVPFVADKGAYTTGSSADLLRSKLQFSEDADGVAMTAACGNVKRTWYLTASLNANPYFASGKGTSGSVFGIANITQLHYVRYYTRIDSAYYKQTAHLNIGASWPPIMDFRGTYDGNTKNLYNITVIDDGEAALGFFGTTIGNATITNSRLADAKVETTRNVPVGLLVGETTSTATVSQISLTGNANIVEGGNMVGGLVGKATGTLTLQQCLVSVQVTGGATTGGLVGYIAGASSTVAQSGVTGYVTGTTNIGGLIGQTAATTTVQHCYSTAAVISDATTSGSYAGGLIGKAASATIKNSYCAALTDAPNFTGKGIIVGTSGTVNNTVYYDKVYFVGTPSGSNANATALSTAELIAKNPAGSGTTWKVDSDKKHYPQVTAHTTLSYFKYLSPLATLPVHFQKYWEDTATGDITTGFIADTALYTSSDSIVNQPTALSDFNTAPAQTVYALENGTGWGFEAGSGQRRMVLCATTKGNSTNTDAAKYSGIRVIAIVREDLVPLKYTVTGESGTRAYVELYYSSDQTNWQGSGVMTASGSAAEVIYDMPKGSYVKVKVTTTDEHAVASVNIGGTTYSTATNGFYVSNGTFSSATSVTVTLKANTPPWGLRREYY